MFEAMTDVLVGCTIASAIFLILLLVCLAGVITFDFVKSQIAKRNSKKMGDITDFPSFRYGGGNLEALQAIGTPGVCKTRNTI